MQHGKEIVLNNWFGWSLLSMWFDYVTVTYVHYLLTTRYEIYVQLYEILNFLNEKKITFKFNIILIKLGTTLKHIEI